MNAKEVVRSEFKRLFNKPSAILVRSPGRVNLIGEHTDYNDGLVMPLAIEQSLFLAVQPRPDRRVVAHSLDLGSSVSFNLDEFSHTGSGWGEYLKGTAWALMEAGYALEGWEGVFSSEIPIGAGLSSSAALELGTAMAFQCVSNFDWVPVEMARLGQRAENDWVGVNSGIMDQLVIALGLPDSALMIDCRSLEYEPVPLPEGVRIVIVDSATRRGAGGLADSAYNDRREECERAARWFGLDSLRDLTSDRLTAEETHMPEVLFRRARHVLTENRRVRDGAQAMRRGDPVRVGEILKEGHLSQRDDFETSRPEIDALVAAANAHPGCVGARLTGGGFGGCAVSLVREAGVEPFINTLTRQYAEATGLEAIFYITRAMQGVRTVGSLEEPH